MQVAKAGGQELEGQGPHHTARVRTQAGLVRSIRSKAKLRTVPRDRVLSRTQGPSLEAQGLSRTDTSFPS